MHPEIVLVDISLKPIPSENESLDSTSKCGQDVNNIQQEEDSENMDEELDESQERRESPLTLQQNIVSYQMSHLIDIYSTEESCSHVPIDDTLSQSHSSSLEEFYNDQHVPKDSEKIPSQPPTPRSHSDPTPISGLSGLQLITNCYWDDESEDEANENNTGAQFTRDLELCLVANDLTTISNLESSTCPHSVASEESFNDSVADPDYDPPRSPSLLQPEEYINTPPSVIPQTPKTIKRMKRKDEDSWKQNIRKKSRNSGLSYESKKGVLKAARKPNLSSCGCKQQCQLLLSDDAKQNLFDSYWNLGNIERQRDYLIRNIKRHDSLRPRVTNSRRKYTLLYAFSYENVDYKVCKKFFLNTLNITDKTVRTAVDKKYRGVGEIPSPDKRGKHRPGIALDNEVISHAGAHIDSFPTVPSHWCRKDSKKVYLEPILNKEKMYALYKQHCQNDNVRPVSRTTYKEILIKKNIGFYIPRKDQCWCHNFEFLSEEEKTEKKLKYDDHQRRKTLAKEEKQKDKDEANRDRTYMCINFDMEAVLYCPLILAKPVFHKRKLATFNFTIFDTRNKQGYCYLWPEFEGKRGANEVATCVYNFIKNVPRSVKHLVMYSDCCPGQNRNSILAYMLLTSMAAEDCHIEVIDYKFLEPGHTYMECDSMHAAIERASEYAKIYIPDDWENVIKLAKKSNPYEVKGLTHSDFIDFKKMRDVLPSTIKSTDGTILSWKMVTWLRFIKNQPDKFYFKFEYSDSEFKEVQLSTRTRARVSSASRPTFTQAYNSQIPIPSVKAKDLMEMLRSGLIPDSYSGYYNNIPKKTRNQVTIPDSDEDHDEVELAANRASYIRRRARRAN